MALHIIDHPMVQHKLSLMRDKNTSTMKFRELLKEISMLMGYEVTRDFPLTYEEIETPLQKMNAPKIAGKKVVAFLYTDIETTPFKIASKEQETDKKLRNKPHQGSERLTC